MASTPPNEPPTPPSTGSTSDGAVDFDLSRWPGATRLLTTALELPASERGDFLDQHVDDPVLRKTLDAILGEEEAEDGSRSFLLPAGARERPIFRDLERTLDAHDDVPQQVGPYRLLEQIGRGGMARVFLATRTEGGFEQRVAVKLIRAQDRSGHLRQRFEQERQILAQLEHPGIARLFDGGETAGQPWFAMELVDGRPIEHHCQETRADLETRLRLFLETARAVAFAHRNLVVHRDIKSSNVLVDDEGMVKLLDFGIARFVESDGRLTATDQRLLTPEFASPEQVQGLPITTASDVYQLGHLLYRLLCTQSPYTGSTTTPALLQRAILTDTPVLPSQAVVSPKRAGTRSGHDVQASVGEDWSSQLAKALRGDLDAIVMKALRKEPERRYATVQELIDDVQAHLDGRPVSARPDSLSYRFAKLVSRNRLASVVTAVAVIVFVAMALAFTLRLAQERDRARDSARRALAVTAFLEELFSDANPNNSGNGEMTARELVSRAPNRIESQLAGEPEIQAQLYALTGRLFDDLGDEQSAELWMSQALSMAEGLGPTASPARLDSLVSLARLRVDQRREDEALEALDEAELAIDSADPASAALLARLIGTRARALASLGRYPESIEEYERVAPFLEQLDQHQWLRLTIRIGHGTALQLSKQDPDLAIEMIAAALDEARHLYGDDHPRLIPVLHDLASAYGSRGYDRRGDSVASSDDDLDQTSALLQEAARITRLHFEEGHPDIARVEYLQGAVAYSRADWDGVRRHYGAARQIYESLTGHQDDAALAAMYVGVADLKTGSHGTAITQLERAREVFSNSSSPNHYRLAVLEYNLGEAHFGLEQWQEAVDFFDSAYTKFREASGPDHPQTRGARLPLADSHLKLAESHFEEGRANDARRHLEQAEVLYEGLDISEERQELLTTLREALD